jgi:hypothetical protein
MLSLLSTFLTMVQIYDIGTIRPQEPKKKKKKGMWPLIWIYTGLPCDKMHINGVYNNNHLPVDSSIYHYESVNSLFIDVFHRILLLHDIN